MQELVQGHRLRLYFGLLLCLCEALLLILFPLVVGDIVDRFVTGRSVLPFHWQLVALAASALGSVGLTWANTALIGHFSEQVTAALRKRLITSAIDAPQAAYERIGAGEIATRASDDIDRITETLPALLPQLCVTVCTIAVSAVGIFMIDIRFLAALLVTVPVYWLTVRTYARRGPAAYEALQSAQSQRSIDLLETVTQLPTIWGADLARTQFARIRAATWDTVVWSMRTRIVQNQLYGGLNVAEFVGLCAVLGLGIVLLDQRTVSVGAVTAALLLFQRLVAPIGALIFMTDDMQRALTSLGRVLRFCVWADAAGSCAKRTNDVDDTPDRSPSARIVELSNVSFAHADTLSLDRVSFHVNEGETVAIVGQSGSGKSTLAALIAGVHSPHAGRIVRHCHVTEVVTITQETHLFIGTLRANLSLVHTPVEDAAIVAAFQRLGGLAFLARAPHGLDSIIRGNDAGHDAWHPTPADRQLIALARAELADPRLVILDEATADASEAELSALDEAAVRMTAGRSALIVTHELSQAAGADRIVFIKQGRIAESGSHDELLAAGGNYAAMWAAQAG